MWPDQHTKYFTRIIWCVFIHKLYTSIYTYNGTLSYLFLYPNTYDVYYVSGYSMNVNWIDIKQISGSRRKEKNERPIYAGIYSPSSQTMHTEIYFYMQILIHPVVRICIQKYIFMYKKWNTFLKFSKSNKKNNFFKKKQQKTLTWKACFRG